MSMACSSHGVFGLFRSAAGGSALTGGNSSRNDSSASPPSMSKRSFFLHASFLIADFREMEPVPELSRAESILVAWSASFSSRVQSDDPSLPSEFLLLKTLVARLRAIVAIIRDFADFHILADCAWAASLKRVRSFAGAGSSPDRFGFSLSLAQQTTTSVPSLKGELSSTATSSSDQSEPPGRSTAIQIEVTCRSTPRLSHLRMLSQVSFPACSLPCWKYLGTGSFFGFAGAFWSQTHTHGIFGISPREESCRRWAA
mmetsp:Transcript_35634/g.83233  ORF Transcript_35634/g.83233 Transcript_35634/m.83233 type:complete len:257 (-) Transcript_35634:77-847(-)